MATQHIVRQGECLSSITDDYGFFPKTVWYDAANLGLRVKRKDGNVLFPGDTLVIPDKHAGSEAGETEMRHRFRRKGVPAKLRLRLVRNDGPRAGVRYILDIDGRLYNGVTDGDGRIDQFIPPRAQNGKLLLGDEEEYELRLGSLDPVTEESGLRTRLLNLGYLAEEPHDREALAAALRRFQKENGLTETGQGDSPTQSKLRQMHGS